MSFFDNIYHSLFGEKNAQPFVAVDQVIKRSESFLIDYTSWCGSKNKKHLVESIWDAYFWNKKGIRKTPNITVFNARNSNGFSVFYQEEIDETHFHYFFDLLAEKVLKLGYKKAMSKVSMREKGNVVETKEMHYLKPKIVAVDLLDQKYGNIQIEYIKTDNQPQNIKFLANTYSDSSYDKPKEFEELVELLLNPEGL